MYGRYTGEVGFRAYLQGIVDKLGGVLDDKEKRYFVEVKDLGRVPIVVGSPDQVIANRILPSIVVSNLTSFSWDGRRYMYCYEYVDFDKSSQPIMRNGEVVGYSRIERRRRVYPIDISYDIELLTRYKSELMILSEYVLKKFKMFDKVYVKDSLNEDRCYDCRVESVSFTTELTDVAERVESCVISVLIHGEIELEDIEKVPAVVEQNISLEVK
jgi:hypothetical protein